MLYEPIIFYLDVLNLEIVNENIKLKIELAREERLLNEGRRQLIKNTNENNLEPTSSSLPPQPAGKIQVKQSYQELSETFIQENDLSLSAETQAFTTIKTNFHGILNDTFFFCESSTQTQTEHYLESGNSWEPWRIYHQI